MPYVTPVGLAALIGVIALAVTLIYSSVKHSREQQRTRQEIADLTARLAAREASDLNAQQAWDEAMDRMYGRRAKRRRARSHLTGLGLVLPFRCRSGDDRGAVERPVAGHPGAGSQP